jgi:hypothetical protein
MSGVRHWYQRRSENGYAPRHHWTERQRLDECLRIAQRVEYGHASPVDELALQAHLKVLLGRGIVNYEDEAIAKAAGIPTEAKPKPDGGRTFA